MREKFMAAAIQMHAGSEKPANLATAERLVRTAAQRGAALIVLPEMFNCWTNHEGLVRAAEPIPGPTSEAAAAWARAAGAILVAGSLAERAALPQHAYNTSLVFGPDGALLAKYRKQHLFDIAWPGAVAVRESDSFLRGETAAATSTELGVIGQAICYDLRFPELFRALADQQAQIVAIPSAFSRATGAAHWSVLLRARAIENQTFVVAANQCGSGAHAMATYGHSQIIDPWGEVLATAAEETEAIVLAELDLAQLREIRARLPALEHRRGGS
ncbi:MAG TPA: carbon-nitrogen hydrolase family protein [Pirellulales bacterium]|nr:carbon-nitrogen hydrolase family protein [Pirellulales bacterium]